MVGRRNRRRQLCYGPADIEFIQIDDNYLQTKAGILINWSGFFSIPKEVGEEGEGEKIKNSTVMWEFHKLFTITEYIQRHSVWTGLSQQCL